MSTETEDLTAAYLAELEREAARLPWNARVELLADVRSHIEVALAEMEEDGADGISRVHAMLAALGEPREIVAAALADEESTPGASESAWPKPPLVINTPAVEAAAVPSAGGPPYPLGLQEIFAIVLLVAGGFLFGVGWLVGLMLLWNSPRWSVREKLVGTFGLPGGYAGVFMLLTRSVGFTAPSWLGMPVLFLLLAAPFATAVFLFLRARRHPAGVGSASSSGRAIGLAVLSVLGGIALLMIVGAALFLSVSSSSGSGSVSPSGEVSQVATYPGAPVPPVSSGSSAP